MTKPVHWHSSSTVRDYSTVMRAAAWGQMPFPPERLQVPQASLTPIHKRPRGGSVSTPQVVEILSGSVRNTHGVC